MSGRRPPSQRSVPTTGESTLHRTRCLPSPTQTAVPRARTCQIEISVRHSRHHAAGPPGAERYLDSVAAAVTRLAERGDEIVFMSPCQGVPEFSTDDSRCAQEVLDRCDDATRGRCHVDADFHTPAELTEVIAGFDAVISTRMHGAIVALGTAVLVLPTAYEFKTHELFAALGLSEWVTDIDEMEPDEFAVKTLRFIDCRDDIRALMMAPVPAARNRALAVADDLRRQVCS